VVLGIDYIPSPPKLAQLYREKIENLIRQRRTAYRNSIRNVLATCFPSLKAIFVVRDDETKGAKHFEQVVLFFLFKTFLHSSFRLGSEMPSKSSMLF
jgi:hypothetical protein